MLVTLFCTLLHFCTFALFLCSCTLASRREKQMLHLGDAFTPSSKASCTLHLCTKFDCGALQCSAIDCITHILKWNPLHFVFQHFFELYITSLMHCHSLTFTGIGCNWYKLWFKIKTMQQIMLHSLVLQMITFALFFHKIPTVRTCLNCNSGGTAIKLDAKEWLHKCIIGQMHQNTREDANCERMQHNGDGCKL